MAHNRTLKERAERTVLVLSHPEKASKDYLGAERRKNEKKLKTHSSQGEHKHIILAYLPSSSQHWTRPQGVKVFMKEIKMTDKISQR